MQGAEREVAYPPAFADPTACRSRKKKLSEAELQVLSAYPQFGCFLSTGSLRPLPAMSVEGLRGAGMQK